MWRPPSLAVGMCLTSGASAENRRRAEFPFLGTTPDPPGPIVSLHLTILSHHIKIKITFQITVVPTANQFLLTSFCSLHQAHLSAMHLKTVVLDFLAGQTWPHDTIVECKKQFKQDIATFSITQTTGLVYPTILDLHIISPQLYWPGDLRPYIHPISTVDYLLSNYYLPINTIHILLPLTPITCRLCLHLLMFVRGKNMKKTDAHCTDCTFKCIRQEREGPLASFRQRRCAVLWRQIQNQTR